VVVAMAMAMIMDRVVAVGKTREVRVVEVD
jgi:hypothetical protein